VTSVIGIALAVTARVPVGQLLAIRNPFYGALRHVVRGFEVTPQAGKRTRNEEAVAPSGSTSVALATGRVEAATSANARDRFATH
jgi:hypothetical protein